MLLLSTQRMRCWRLQSSARNLNFLPLLVYGLDDRIRDSRLHHITRFVWRFKSKQLKVLCFMKLVLLSNLVAFTHSANKRWFSTPFRYVEGAHSNDLRFVENGLFGKSFRVREVNHDDITMLDKCNRLNLPENYTNDFYEAQLNRWPKLSIIVEAENDVVSDIHVMWDYLS